MFSVLPLLALAVSTVSAERLGIQVTAEVDGCPAPGAVVDQLLRLPPRPGPAPPLAARVLDLGDAFRVELAGRAKAYRDPRRLCDERARTAALYLLLSPRPRRRLRIDLTAAGLLSGGVPAPLSGGGSLRLAVGAPWLAGVLGVAVHAPATLAMERYDVSLLRVPLDLSLRGALGRGRLEASAEAGLLLSLQRVEQLGSSGPAVSSAPALGLRAALGLHLWLSERLALGAAATLEWLPQPGTVLFSAPEGSGALPGVFVSGLLGVLARLR